jgi:hypothetical protein
MGYSVCVIDVIADHRTNTRTGVAEADWVFKTTFDATSEQLQDEEADLLFEGLDTYCDITLVDPQPLQAHLQLMGMCRTGRR